jgi:hypothetical protein
VSGRLSRSPGRLARRGRVRGATCVLALGLLAACGGGEALLDGTPAPQAGAGGQATAAGGGKAGTSGLSGGGQSAAGQAGAAGVSGGGQAGGAGGQAGQPAAGQAGQAGTAGVSGGGQAGAGGSAGASGAPGEDPLAWATCQASDQAFVRRAMLAILGRRPLGQAEVNVYVDLIKAVDLLDPAAQSPHPPGSDLRGARTIAAIAMMAREEYLFRWIDVYRDALRVQRTEEMANPLCYGMTKRADGTAVARLVREQPPEAAGGDGLGEFTMRDVLLSSLKLDDVSPVYVANLFGMLTLTFPGANAAPDKLELSRRDNFGAWFDGVYLHRDAVCLKCHNSEFSVTFSDDPAKNRHFPTSGNLEAALFGASTGPAKEGDADGPARMHAPLRYDGFVAAGFARPWGWAADCGTYADKGSVPPDIAQVDARFGNLTGDRTSAWDLSASLQSGFRKLRDHGLSQGPDGLIPDPDEAFAYLTATNIVEQVWREVMGTPLTIANYFPRNAAARDQLLSLAEGFVSSGFSNRALIFQILQSPYFNLLAPDAGCGPRPYAMPRIFDPWTSAEADPARRGNSLADGVVPLSSRTTARAAYAALGWPLDGLTSFPDRDSDEGNFQSAIGVFLKNGEPGFRGFDFQARLGWEQRMGACQKPGNVATDAIDEIASNLGHNEGAQVRDLVVALKDRLVGEPDVDPADEQPALEAMLGAPLDAPAAALGPDPTPALRRVCGALVASPQFLMGGIVPPDRDKAPRLTPHAATYRFVCQQIADAGLTDGLTLTCADGALTLTQGK